MLSRCFLDFPVSVGVFVIGLSQISSLFSFKKGQNMKPLSYIQIHNVFG